MRNQGRYFRNRSQARTSCAGEFRFVEFKQDAELWPDYLPEDRTLAPVEAGRFDIGDLNLAADVRAERIKRPAFVAVACPDVVLSDCGGTLQTDFLRR